MVLELTLSVHVLHFVRTLLADHAHLTLDPTNNTDYSGDPYAFGVDPVSDRCANVN